MKCVTNFLGHLYFLFRVVQYKKCTLKINVKMVLTCESVQDEYIFYQKMQLCGNWVPRSMIFSPKNYCFLLMRDIIGIFYLNNKINYPTRVLHLESSILFNEITLQPRVAHTQILN